MQIKITSNLYIHKYISGLTQCKGNPSILISKSCPFCGEKGKRPFRYNIKLKVGKSYCCGVSFKEEYWLRKLLTDRLFCKKKFIEHDPLLKKEQKEYFLKKLEDNVDQKNEDIVKSGIEDDLPF